MPKLSWGYLLWVCAVGGAVLGWNGWQDLSLSRVAKTDPQELTCQALGDRGPGDNAHVRMSDYLLLIDAIAVEERLGAEDVFWDKAWYPAVPLDGEFARAWLKAPEGAKPRPPSDPRVVVQKGFGFDAMRKRISRGEPIQGMVINEIGGLDGDVERILANAYPGFDPQTCWVLEEHRRPKDTQKAWTMFLGGCLLLLVPGVFFLRSMLTDHAVRKQLEAARARDRALGRDRPDVSSRSPR